MQELTGVLTSVLCKEQISQVVCDTVMWRGGRFACAVVDTFKMTKRHHKPVIKNCGSRPPGGVAFFLKFASVLVVDLELLSITNRISICFYFLAEAQGFFEPPYYYRSVPYIVTVK